MDGQRPVAYQHALQLYSSTVNTYNGRDQVTVSTQIDNTTNAQQATTFEYDGHGRPVRLHKPEWFNGSGNLDQVTTYNVDDTVASVTDPRGAVTMYTYGNPNAAEKRALVTNIVYATPEANPTPSNPLHVPPVAPVTFSYDGAGNRTIMYDGTGILSYEYDELSRLKKETKYFPELTSASSGGYYDLTYTYHLTGGLKSITEPFGHTVTYSVDKLGRTTSINGSGTGGSIVYASNIKHRAFGELKEMTLGTTAATTVSMAYDSALQPLTYEADNSTTGTSYVQKAGYSYHNDGSVNEIDNVRDGNFDQKSEYDFAGRLKKNKVGANGSSFSQTMTYDAFNNLTSRENDTYGTYSDSFFATYTNNRKSSTGSSDTYDLAGNVVHTSSPAMNGGRPYTDVKNWNVNVAGLAAHWDETGPWGTQTHSADLSFDGDGREVKKHTLDSRGDITWYYFYSTVTGQKITDMGTSGTFAGTRVYMGETVIHDTSVYDDLEASAIGFQVSDPISGSSQELLSSGEIPNQQNHPETRNELAGLGTLVPSSEPQSYPLPSRGKGGFVGDAEWKCIINGMEQMGMNACTNLLRGLPMVVTFKGWWVSKRHWSWIKNYSQDGRRVYLNEVGRRGTIGFVIGPPIDMPVVGQQPQTSQPAPLTDEEKEKLRKAREKAEKNAKNSKKCADFLKNHGIDLDAVINAMNNHTAYSADRSTITVEQAGFYPADIRNELEKRPKEQLARISTEKSLGLKINEFVKTAYGGNINAFVSQTYTNTVFYRDIYSGGVFHEALHLATRPKDDIQLAAQLGLGTFTGTAQASEAINKALDENDCPHGRY